MLDETIFTFQTRIGLSDEQNLILDQCAKHFSTVEHSLFAEISRGKDPFSCKNEFLKKFNITARQFNSCWTNLKGKIEASIATQKRIISDLKQRIASLDKVIEGLEKKTSKKFVLHQKKRRRKILESRLTSVQNDLNQKKIRLCFGSKKLFHAQYNLEENGFSSHAEWKTAWQKQRNDEFFLLGSKDETGGNQTCTATLQEDQRLSLRLRLPKDLEKKYGKYIHIPDVVFAYGQEVILAALNHPEGQALSYRFKKDSKGWRVFVSTAIRKKDSVSKEGIGVIGIDLNTDHIACSETDRFGNLIETKIFSWISYGKTKGQLQASTGDLCKEIVEWAKKTQKPVVIENLDFQTKKLSLKNERNKKASRLLSSFAYGLFFQFLRSRAFKESVDVHQVNPAFTSTIGRINYTTRYGLSIHLAAALCIARRYQKFSETPSLPLGKIPDGKGNHVAFVLPERNRTKHVWHYWGKVHKKIQTVLAAHFQAKRSSSPLSPTPVTAKQLLIVTGEIPIRESLAKLLG